MYLIFACITKFNTLYLKKENVSQTEATENGFLGRNIRFQLWCMFRKVRQTSMTLLLFVMSDIADYTAGMHKV